MAIDGVTGSVIVAVIGSAGLIGAALVNAKTKDHSLKGDAPVTGTKPQLAAMAMTDVTGDWRSKTADHDETLRIVVHNGRTIEGHRIFRGKDGKQRSYIVTGYFDGLLIALACTSEDIAETRTLTFLMQRTSGNELRGTRTYWSNGKMAATQEYKWTRSR